jgi:hypothetical protein
MWQTIFQLHKPITKGLSALDFGALDPDQVPEQSVVVRHQLGLNQKLLKRFVRCEG